MQSVIPPRLGSEIGLKRADWLNAKFLVDFREREFLVVHLGHRVDVYDPAQDTQLGVIRIGSPISGAIWKSAKCIGEYELDDAGRYSVLSIQDGFKILEDCQEIHPLVHLLRALTGAD